MNVHVDPDLAVRKRHLPFETVALVLQGGGALGVYQAGVYEALAEEGHSRAQEPTITTV